MAAAAPSVDIRVLVDFFEKSIATSWPERDFLSFQSVHSVGLLNLCSEAFITSWENSWEVRSLVDRRCRGDDSVDWPVYFRVWHRNEVRKALAKGRTGAIAAKFWTAGTFCDEIWSSVKGDTGLL